MLFVFHFHKHYFKGFFTNNNALSFHDNSIKYLSFTEEEINGKARFKIFI